MQSSQILYIIWRITIIAEAENYLLFNTLLFHFTVKSSKTVEHKVAFCIPLELSDGIFELYHSGLMISHQGLTRTYYKIRQDFFIRNLYKYLHLYIMSCRVCSAWRDIPFNQKQCSWQLWICNLKGRAYPSYRFSIYLDLLNERIHTIRDIVKENQNQTIQKRLHQHGSESPRL